MALRKTWGPEEIKVALARSLAAEGLRLAKDATVSFTITPGDRPGESETVSASVDVEPIPPAGSLRAEKAPTKPYCACGAPSCDICHS